MSKTIKQYSTERRGRVVDTAAPYSGGAGFKSGSGEWLSWVFSVFSQSLQENSGIVP
jgi:hypothetical protein